MGKYEIIAESLEAADLASEAIDAAMDRHSGKNEIHYRLATGEQIPGIDTGYLNGRGLARIRNKARAGSCGGIRLERQREAQK